MVSFGGGARVTERELFNGSVIALLALAPVTWLLLTRVTAPYGRHTRAGWGPQISSTAGWMVMESPAVVAFAVIYLLGSCRGCPTSMVLLALWQIHYLHRTVVFPLRRRGGNKPMPLGIVGMGFAFNLVNAYLNARWISQFGVMDAGWLFGGRLLCGGALFFLGFGINVQSDHILMSLRAGGGRGYAIPRSGLFRFVSSPNYLGEIIEWFGWALATWSLPGLAFALYTTANLVPRAVANHRWYQQNFPDYPSNRKAIVPWIY